MRQHFRTMRGRNADTPAEPESRIWRRGAPPDHRENAGIRPIRAHPSHQAEKRGPKVGQEGESGPPAHDQETP